MLRPLLFGVVLLLVVGNRCLQLLLTPLTRVSPDLRRISIRWSKRAFNATVGLLTLTRETRIIVTGGADVFTRDARGRAVGLVRPWHSRELNPCPG